MGDQSKQELLHTPEGLWDHYGADYAQYRTVTQMIGETMHRYGYEDIKTPTFEFFDVFSREIGTTPSRELYKFFDKDGNTQVDSEASIQAMETCKKMYDAGITFNNSSWDDMVAGMGADKFACIADAVWMVGSIKEAAPDQSGKWAVMELPRFQADKEAQGASNGGSVLAVPSDSKSTEASKAFVKFVMENVDANVEGFQNYGLYPSYLKALDPVNQF